MSIDQRAGTFGYEKKNKPYAKNMFQEGNLLHCLQKPYAPLRQMLRAGCDCQKKRALFFTTGPSL
jgi:hypothetical protein